MKKMYAVITRHGIIDRVELQEQCGRMSIGTYNKLKSYFEKEYEDKIAYDKNSKCWYDLNPGEKSISEEIQRVITQYH